MGGGAKLLCTWPPQPVCFHWALKEKSFHLHSCTGVWCHTAGSSCRFISVSDLQGIMNASVPGPKCLSGHLDKAPRSRCGENPGSTV